MTKTSWIRNFIDNEKSGGLILIACTIISIILANSPIAEHYFSIWHFTIANQPLEYWINDGLMAIFFFQIGLELLKEIYEGELSNVRKAILPVIGAVGGMLIPAGIYLFFNWGTQTQSGAGIPMATDIAFALGILSLLGSRVPVSLKVFLTALAVIDDLGAIIVIAVFYTSTIVWINLAIALGIFMILLLCNKLLKINYIIVYIVGGVAMWYFMLNSGIHATIAGVMLAFTIPYKKGVTNSPAHRIQHSLHYPVTFFILPLFALANTAIILHSGWIESIEQPFAIGILLGLIVGKPLGIVGFCYFSVKMKLCSLPNLLQWKQLIGIGMLGGIGFTMSIFVTLLAFDDADIINNAKLMILFASLVSGILGYCWLNAILKKKEEV